MKRRFDEIREDECFQDPGSLFTVYVFDRGLDIPIN